MTLVECYTNKAKRVVTEKSQVYVIIVTKNSKQPRDNTIIHISNSDLGSTNHYQLLYLINFVNLNFYRIVYI